MLPTILAKQLEKGICDYIETTFPMTNEPFKGSVQNLLATKDAVYHEPYVAVRLPFRQAEEMPTCFTAIHTSYLPYVHQQKAFDRLTGDDGRSTLVATGTGSGKTECFLYPILEYCYQHRGEKGIKAIIIYPMNALASDQAKRIAMLVDESPELHGNVSVGMYVGGHEKNASRLMTKDSVITDHETLLNSPPDILMTNYKMLDYLLVRPKDAALWKDNQAETLKYIAVDELHTFDGAQGTDLACLLRRLKRRLGIYDGYLCCIGTSATMGSDNNTASIVEYASEIFGELFEKDSVITEDRLTPVEFFDGVEVEQFVIPTVEQLENLEQMSSNDDQDSYLAAAVKAWFPSFALDVLSEEGRLVLGKELMRHHFFQQVINYTGGNYFQISNIAEAFNGQYPELKNSAAASTLLNSLFALVSHARIGTKGALRPFLFVQVQLWMRELRRLLAKVDGEEVTYALAADLNEQQVMQYLPVVNCRDCGITGWVTVLNERNDASVTKLDAFYNQYFRADDRVSMMFPSKGGEPFSDAMPARLCPHCMHLTAGPGAVEACPNCGTKTIRVYIPPKNDISGTKERRQYICPCCGSRRGLSLIGLRNATEISASIAQLFASKFNDDKKTLAFSDSVQDAAHKAGFFNSRTWSFGLRSAIQHYCDAGGAGQSLQDFQDGFIAYWHKQMPDDQFVGFFIAPNMVWRRSYEELLKNRKFGHDQQAKDLMSEIENRLKYEIMLEYGLMGKIGRTLEKSGCSVLSFVPEEIDKIADAVQERITNELGILKDETIEDYQRMVLGYMNLLRKNGAFQDSVFDAYIADAGNTYFLTEKYNRWLPGSQPGRNTPRFIAERTGNGKRTKDFDSLSDKKYIDWISVCCKTVLVDPSILESLSRIILEEAVKSGLVVELTSSANYKVYGLNKQHVCVSNNVVHLRCNKCGSVYAVSADNKNLWESAPCPRMRCDGHVVCEDIHELDYYGKLYRTGDIGRVNAREHTGLLERDNREKLEKDFKLDKGLQKFWDPNVLSCTPTLEMGIDIGDLSTVVLCSMPPAQSQFLQRSGRAGRKDGNALTLAVSNARPHDLYFYADPLDMISGNVTPPKVFLQASAVLERQFFAFCMDSWVKQGVPEGAIPEKVGIVLNKLDKHPENMFPFNFMNFVQSKLSVLLNSFVLMFSKYLDDTSREELDKFARGSDTEKRSMFVELLDVFAELKKQQQSLKKSIKTLQELIKKLEEKPEDSSFENEIKELKGEAAALTGVLHEIGNKNIFNFLSDEGLLPNYAFPEAGIILRAVLYRKEEKEGTEAIATGKQQYEKMVYEYNRSAASAISEFAPSNSFYVDGRKLTIDQVDLTTSQMTKWRLCPNCSHAQIEEAGKNVASCPNCGSPEWADAGQVRNMLKVQMVYSNMDYTKSLINDESDGRTNKFYCKQLLVDVDEAKDIHSAYRMDNTEFPFGYEFVRKATLREINFGESDTIGEKLFVSGVEEVRKGFKVCKYCGKLQTDRSKPNHSYACKTRSLSEEQKDDAFEECLFLYREFSTEVLRLLIPATTFDSTNVKTESFTAAFMLGMKEYFGNVDHLRATVCEVPVPEADYRKQYLVIYDSVPGGTGYLKQLMNQKNSLVEIFEKALHVMEMCSCNDDPHKDGCYHCLYAYKQSRNIGNISRNAAVRMLKAILSGKDKVEKINKISDISVNPLFDSELEARFMDAIKAKAGTANVKDTVRNGKHSYYVKIGETNWEIEPQVLLGAAEGVAVACKPDFVFWPVNAPGHLPVAVFTDGFTYHKDITADDTLKREAIRRSGRFRIWTLSFRDVQNVFVKQGTYATQTLDANAMPYGTKMFKNTLKNDGFAEIGLDKLSSFDALLFYLTTPDAEQVLIAHANAYAFSLLQPTLLRNEFAFKSWNDIMNQINEQTHFYDTDFEFGKTFFGVWNPASSDGSCLSIYAGVPMEKVKDGPVTVSVCLKDKKDSRTDKYEEEWNGFWQFINVMQFAKEFMAFTEFGLENMAYLELKPMEDTVIITSEPATTGDDAWDAIKELLFSEDAKDFADRAKEEGLPVPEEDNIGFELESADGQIIATIEIAWPGNKIGFLIDEQLTDKEKLEEQGWKILNLINIVEAKAWFDGGTR